MKTNGIRFSEKRSLITLLALEIFSKLENLHLYLIFIPFYLTCSFFFLLLLPACLSIQNSVSTLFFLFFFIFLFPFASLTHQFPSFLKYNLKGYKMSYVMYDFVLAQSFLSGVYQIPKNVFQCKNFPFYIYNIICGYIYKKKFEKKNIESSVYYDIQLVFMLAHAFI